MNNFQCLSAMALVTLLGLSPSAVRADGESWVDRIDFKGDLRLRYEGIDEDGEEDRNRMRFRTRFGLTADVQDDLKVVLQLATGGDNPVSTNQSFDDGFSRKDIRLDLAYVDWRVSDALSISAGKIRNPLFRAGKVPLIWDGDLNPEGFAATYSQDAFFGTAAVLVAEERGSADDSLTYALQAGMKFDLGDAGSLTAGLGYLAYTDTVGNAPFYDGNPRGNTVDINGDYVNDYRNTEAFAEWNTRVADWPLSVFAHYVVNSDVSSGDTGIAFGVKLGAAKDSGQSEFGWTYMDLEANAVIGTFSDSDFGGGGTDAEGHILKAKYAFSKKVALAGTLFVNEREVAANGGVDYNRLQIDIEFKFD